jgi:putative ABC transport system permease protein
VSPASTARTPIGLRVYRLLLRACPRAFREGYGAEIEDAFLATRAEPCYGGAAGGVRFWIDIAADLSVALARLRRSTAADDRFDESTNTPLARIPRPVSALTHDIRAAAPSALPVAPPVSASSSHWRSLHMWRTDLVSALRVFRSRPGLAAVAVISLGVGLGGNALIFGLVDSLVLRPFPFPDPDRLVTVSVAFPKLSAEERFIETLSPAEYLDIRGLATLQHVSAFDLGNRNISGGDQPERVFTALVWGNPLASVGMAPVHGRGFLPEEMRKGGPHVAVLSHRVWLSRFGGDAALVGRQVRINGEPTTIVGIMPPGLLLAGTDLWLPLTADPSEWQRNGRQFSVIARIAPRHTIEQVNAQLATLAAQTTRDHGSAMKEYEGWRLTAIPLTRALTREQRPAGLLLLATAAIVLLIACVNLANVWLARAAERQRDVAIRVALGASRSAIVRSLLLETFVVSFAGVIVGVVLAWAGLNAARALIPEQIRAFGFDVGMTGRVAGYTIALAGLAGLAIGIVPALQASVTRPESALRERSGSISHSRRSMRLRYGLIVSEVALAAVLLAGAGLLLRTYVHLHAIDPGFNRDRVLTMRLTLPPQKYNREAVIAFFDDLVRRVRALPGVDATAAASQFPPLVNFTTRIRVEGAESVGDGELPTATFSLTTPGLFDTLGIRLRSGRLLEERDLGTAPRVAVVNEAFVRRHLGQRAPLGARVALADGSRDAQWIEIVGVTSDIRSRGLTTPPSPEIYLPVAQMGGWWNQLFLLVRTTGDPRSVLPAVRNQVRQIDPDQPVYAIQTLDEVFDAARFQPRVSTTLMGWFAAIALLIAAVGLYGVLAHAVSARTREIGIRMALGADRAVVVGRVVGQATLLVAIGTLIGIAGVLALGPLMGRLLQDVTPRDPLTLAATSVALLFVGVLAALVPARRASRVDPVLALRSE